MSGRSADRGPARQPFMPEAAANPASVDPPHHRTAPHPWRLHDGHLDPGCARRHDGAPACPACLRERLDGAARRTAAVPPRAGRGRGD